MAFSEALGAVALSHTCPWAWDETVVCWLLSVVYTAPNSRPSYLFISGPSPCPLWVTVCPFQSIRWSVCLSLGPPAALWVQLDSLVKNPDLRLEKRAGLNSCMAHAGPVGLKQPRRPSIAVCKGPAISLLSLFLWLSRANSHSICHNQWTAASKCC